MAQATLNHKVGAILKTVREHRGLTKKSVAKSLSIPELDVAAIEAGLKPTVGWAVACRLALFLGIKIEDCVRLPSGTEATQAPSTGILTTPAPVDQDTQNIQDIQDIQDASSWNTEALHDAIIKDVLARQTTGVTTAMNSRITLYIKAVDQPAWADVKVYAALHRVSLSEIVTQAVQQYLNNLHNTDNTDNTENEE